MAKPGEIMFPFKRKTLWKRIKSRVRRFPLITLIVAGCGFFMYQLIMDVFAVIIAFIVLKILIFKKRIF